MGRWRALVIAVAVVLGAAAPAAAQTPGSTVDSVPDSTDTTLPPVTDPGSPGGPGDTTTTTVPGSPPTTVDPGTNGDAPPESVPQDTITVPDATVPPNQPNTVPPPRARVVQVDVQTARAQALAKQAAYQSAVDHEQVLEAALASLQGEVDQLAATSRKAVQDLTAAHDDLVASAVDAYVRGGDGDPEVWAGNDDQSGQRRALLSAIADRDRAAIERYKAAQAAADKSQQEKAAQLTDTQAQLDLARLQEAEAQSDLNGAELELAVTSAGGNIVIHGFVFPVASPHTFSEDFGDPRLPGTPQAHPHQGCDVIAAEGTELYAAERGVITQVDASGLGGNGIWLKGESGTYYYYAHLSAFVLGLAAGQLVEAGQLIGYVGHTGDAYGPHLHFEVHPNGGPAVDPYPILLAADPLSAAPVPAGASARP
jgi:murein DD-endopeptidase MepM/ murein hydrolase activator NlpD